ncbi:MAG: Uncharacterized protein K0S09_1561 [Sphingobacteriaceae bacterium]|jgi:alkylated DNA repair dioxygenase AlkB|nr:Uncharacterized protein [Sphingobacteriaceae bacterium]
MNTLFPLENRLPEGFKYSPEFISPEEEKYLLDVIAHSELHTFTFQGFEAKRSVASFGYDWNFDSRKLSKGKDIPEGLSFLIGKVAEYLCFQSDDFAEVLLTEYPVGSVINWHRDAPPFDVVVGISLLSDCTFRFRPYDKARQGRGSIISLPVKRRSLYVISGASRSGWEHSIQPVKAERFSITLRTLRDGYG